MLVQWYGAWLVMGVDIVVVGGGIGGKEYGLVGR